MAKKNCLGEHALNFRCFYIKALFLFSAVVVLGSVVNSVTYPCHIIFIAQCYPLNTIMILSFRTDRSGQTVQTQIRLLPEEHSDQGLHCLLFHLHHFDKIFLGLASLFEFKVDYSKDFWCPEF